jgi:hypothetical protein
VGLQLLLRTDTGLVWKMRNLLECSTIRLKGYCHTRLLDPFELHMFAGIAVTFLLVVVCRVFSTLVSSLADAPRTPLVKSWLQL